MIRMGFRDCIFPRRVIVHRAVEASNGKDLNISWDAALQPP